MSTKKLYVGNLPFNATSDEVRAAFEAFGTVQDVSLVTDRDTGQPRGDRGVFPDAAARQPARGVGVAAE